MTRLDGDRSTVDWQRSPTRIAVLPIGAFEQHGGRLPLRTDTILAEHFAGEVAEALDAALLPALPFATSIEHTGFRGSISLRPETAMAVIRDLAANLERQGFRRLIIISGHGGNFFLGPVVRDLNAADGALKLIVTGCGADHDPEAPKGGGCEVHAGASENSRLLALRPDLVGPPEAALPSGGGLGPEFRRSDFDTFGIGGHDPSGVWGDARGGDAERGALMNARIATGLIAHLRQRLDWLERQPRFGGTGGVALRPLQLADIDDGLRLCRLAGWNQLRAEWTLLLERNPAGCLAAVRNGEVVGTVAALRHVGCGWIGMVLVDPAHRRAGIGSRLLRGAMDALGEADPIRLDATPAGKAVYDGLGFRDEFELVRLERAAAVPSAPAIDGLRPMVAADLPQVVALDGAAVGFERPELIAWLLAAAPERAWVVAAGGGITAACLGRPGACFTQIGPVLAGDDAQAAALVAAACAGSSDRMGLDAVAAPAWLDILSGMGFIEQRRFTRMVRGGDPDRQPRPGLYAIAGPELG